MQDQITNLTKILNRLTKILKTLLTKYLLSKFKNSLYYSNMYDIEKLQQILVSDAALKFNTNILKIALNFEEDKVAAIIIANYPLQLDITTIDFAIQG